MSEDYFTDRSHVLIAGVTGSRTNYGGKTACANWWASTWGRKAFDLVIFFNAKADAAPERHAQTTVRTVSALADAVADGNGHVCLTPSSSNWEAVHERLRHYVDALPSDMDKLVVHDEAPEYDGDSLQWFVRVAGNGSSCKSLILAQAPGDLSTGVRRQCMLTWIGPVTENNRHVFRANNRESHFDAIQAGQEPYHWTVMTGPDEGDRDEYQPVPKDYA